MNKPQKSRKPGAGVAAVTSKQDEETKQLHVNIPLPLHKKFRLKTLEQGQSMNQVVEDLIKGYVWK
jgi:hypothetical protein